MLYRILRDLGSMDSTRRQAAILMARGLPWEDLEQFLAFYDRGREDAKRNALMLLMILLVVVAGSALVFAFAGQSPATIAGQNAPHVGWKYLPAICAAIAIPAFVGISYFGSKNRAKRGLHTVFDEIDDPAFVPIALRLLSERHADHFSFRVEMFKAIGRLLPEISVEQCSDWTPEERHSLTLGLHSVLPASAGGRDALSHSPADFALVILKVLQRIGDSREEEIVRLVSTIDPVTDQHQKVREASVKCLKSIEKRLQTEVPATSEVTEERVTTPARPTQGTETDVRHLLRAGLRQVRANPDRSG